MSTVIDVNTNIAELVTERPSRARVFEKFGMDYCCGGQKPLHEVCAQQALELEVVLEALRAADEADAEADEADVAAMSMSELCDHIEAVHHDYLRHELPQLTALINKISSVHGENVPWTLELRTIFSNFALELHSHMMKEEQVLFPMIREIEAGRLEAAEHCGGVHNPVRAMEMEHDNAAGALERIGHISSNYTPHADACDGFRTMLRRLQQLEANMHQHIHKENNILFPRALEAVRK